MKVVVMLEGRKFYWSEQSEYGLMGWIRLPKRENDKIDFFFLKAMLICLDHRLGGQLKARLER